MLITWAGSVSSYERYDMGKIKQESDNVTHPGFLALCLISVYFASQIEFSNLKRKV